LTFDLFLLLIIIIKFLMFIFLLNWFFTRRKILNYLFFQLKAYLLNRHFKIRRWFLCYIFIKLRRELFNLISKFEIYLLIKWIFYQIFSWIILNLICLNFFFKYIKFLFLFSWWIFEILIVFCIQFFKIFKKLNLISTLFKIFTTIRIWIILLSVK
jgi:hypothetical protein